MHGFARHGVRLLLLGAAGIVISLNGCGGDDDGPNPFAFGTGGYPTGGYVPFGGITVGGFPVTGGYLATGGRLPTGGHPPTGGDSPTGGYLPTGGASAGGYLPTAGAFAGGYLPTGGALAGGYSPTGGHLTNGGEWPAGGASGGLDFGGTTPGGSAGSPPEDPCPSSVPRTGLDCDEPGLECAYSACCGNIGTLVLVCSETLGWVTDDERSQPCGTCPDQLPEEGTPCFPFTCDDLDGDRALCSYTDDSCGRLDQAACRAGAWAITWGCPVDAE